jgi:glycosyltransferase involved in cell wall biosynthesis
MSDASPSPPLAVVITPVYNGAKFLAEMLDSVQAQTYANIVHIVLDNASTDDTPQILARYAAARVPVITRRNERTLPLGENWNAAVGLVPGEAKYFRVLCADDVMSPEFMSRTIDLLQRNPGVVAVGCQLHHRGQNQAQSGWDLDREVFSGSEAVRRFFLGAGIIIAHQITFRRDMLDRRTPFFEPDMTTNDTDALLDILRHGDWGFVHETLATTREHDDTDTNRLVRPVRLDLCEHLALLERHAAFGLGEEAGARLTRTFRRYYLRRLLRWRIAGEAQRVERHMRRLRALNVSVGFWHYLDAAADWPLGRLGLRPKWAGYPA